MIRDVQGSPGGTHCINLGLGDVRHVHGIRLALGDLSTSLRTQKRTHTHTHTHSLSLSLSLSLSIYIYTHTHTLHIDVFRTRRMYHTLLQKAHRSKSLKV